MAEGRERSAERGGQEMAESAHAQELNEWALSWKSPETRQRPKRGQPGQFPLPLSPHVGTDLYSPSVWGPGRPVGPALLLLGCGLLMRRGAQSGLLGQVFRAPRDGAGPLGRILPAPGFLRAAGVESWLGRFRFPTHLPKCLPVPLEGDSDVVAGPPGRGTLV